MNQPNISKRVRELLAESGAEHTTDNIIEAVGQALCEAIAEGTRKDELPPQADLERRMRRVSMDNSSPRTERSGSWHTPSWPRIPIWQQPQETP